MRYLLAIMMIIALMLGGCQATYDKDTLVRNQDILSLKDQCAYERRQMAFDNLGGYVLFDGFAGAMTLHEITAPSPLKVTLSAPKGEGQFKVVLVDSYDRIIVLEEATQIDVSEGTYRLRLIGNDASGAVFVSINPLEASQSVTVSETVS